jgi:hypothetical protein
MADYSTIIGSNDRSRLGGLAFCRSRPGFDGGLEVVDIHLGPVRAVELSITDAA